MQPQAPERIYKYMSRQYAEQLVNSGSLQIGTLHDFKNTEKHRAEVGDAQEGSRSTIISPNEKGELHINYLEINGSTFENVTSGPSSGHRFVSEEVSPQYHIFCFSLESNKEAMEKMGYDTCVEIREVDMFLFSLTEALRRKTPLVSMSKRSDYIAGDCHYIDDTVLPITLVDNTVIKSSDVPVFFRKHPDFSYQTEGRAVWRPLDRAAAKPIIVQDDYIKSLCKIIQL